MPWVRLDEGFPDHRKLAELGDYAPLCGWLFVCGLAYCNRQLTDGRIPWAHVVRLASFRHIGVETAEVPGMASFGEDVDADDLAQRLIDVGLWENQGTHIVVHDYHVYQPSRAEVEAEREQKRLAGRAGGIARAQQRAKQTASTPPSTQLASRQPECLADTQAESKPVPVPVPVSGSGTEKDQDHRASAARVRVDPVEKSDGEIHAQLCALVRAEWKAGRLGQGEADDMEHLKSVAGRARLPYDGVRIQKAMEAVHASRGRMTA